MTDATRNEYDDFATEYAEGTAANAYNAHYERPATLALLGDVAGQRVLDAGSGPGLFSEQLVARGAIVTGVDASAAQVEQARARLGPAATFLRGDLTQPLALPDNSFDAVVASLVLHYLEDWLPVLREFHRVLRPGGRFVMSTHHPFLDHQLAGRDNYFETYQWSEVWGFDGKDVTMTFWHRPLHAITDAITGAGFQLDVVSEPRPLPDVERLFPADWTTLTTEPRFLFLSARAV